LFRVPPGRGRGFEGSIKGDFAKPHDTLRGSLTSLASLSHQREISSPANAPARDDTSREDLGVVRATMDRDDHMKLESYRGDRW